MEGDHVLEAAGARRALLGAAVDQDWTRPIPQLEWTVAQAVTHMCEVLLWYATDLAAGEQELGTVELRVRPGTGPAGLLQTLGAFVTVQARVVDGTPPGERGWRWHCAPLEEWDGLNPVGRR